MKRFTSTGLSRALVACAGLGLLVACNARSRGHGDTTLTDADMPGDGSTFSDAPPADLGPPHDLGPVDFGSAPRCGDGVTNGTEQCDGGGIDTETCDSDCTLPTCGDRHVNAVAGEECDDGPSGSSTCSASCALITGPSCGNGIVESGETCDDHNTFSSDGCSADCQTEPGYMCSGSPSVCTMMAVRTIDRTATPALAIPDNTPAGVTNTLAVTGAACTLSSLTVDVDIAHTYIGDLIVTLRSPSGVTVTLHSRTGASTHDILGTYPTSLTVDGPGALTDFSGASVIGSWVMTVSDNAAVDTGTFNSWALHITCS